MPAGFRPAFDGQKCSLGYQLIEWMEEFTCHGPGDVQGEPLDLSIDPEFEQLVIDCYELDPRTGRRVTQSTRSPGTPPWRRVTQGPRPTCTRWPRAASWRTSWVPAPTRPARPNWPATTTRWLPSTC